MSARTGRDNSPDLALAQSEAFREVTESSSHRLVATFPQVAEDQVPHRQSPCAPGEADRPVLSIGKVWMALTPPRGLPPFAEQCRESDLTAPVEMLHPTFPEVGVLDKPREQVVFPP